MRYLFTEKNSFLIVGMLLFAMIGTVSCEKENEALQEYGVPSGIDLSEPCPGNGTWYTTDMGESVAKALSAAPILYQNQFDAKVVIKDWLVEITPIEYYNTGLFVDVMWVRAYDFRPQLADEVYKGYIDPNSIGNDSEGDPIYKGVMKNGWELRYWDFSAPSHLFMNFSMNPDKDDWWHKTLRKY